MKSVGILVVVIIILAAGLYLGRHQVKSLLGMNPAPTAVPAMQASPTTSTAAPSDNIYKTASSASKGTYLTDFAGKTLYVFDKDTTGVSNCTGQCLVIWPYYTSGATAQKTFPANISVITRTDDGKMQFAWKGLPLYYYSKDAAAGDTLGDGIGGIWHLVKP
ncbi:MAG: hypothetical protein ACHQT7_01440 [Candidatus Levyibacteriota bacterium]